MRLAFGWVGLDAQEVWGSLVPLGFKLPKCGDRRVIFVFKVREKRDLGEAAARLSRVLQGHYVGVHEVMIRPLGCDGTALTLRLETDEALREGLRKGKFREASLFSELTDIDPIQCPDRVYGSEAEKLARALILGLRLPLVPNKCGISLA